MSTKKRVSRFKLQMLISGYIKSEENKDSHISVINDMIYSYSLTMIEINSKYLEISISERRTISLVENDKKIHTDFDVNSVFYFNEIQCEICGEIEKFKFVSSYQNLNEYFVHNENGFYYNANEYYCDKCNYYVLYNLNCQWIQIMKGSKHCGSAHRLISPIGNKTKGIGAGDDGDKCKECGNTMVILINESSGPSIQWDSCTKRQWCKNCELIDHYSQSTY